MPANGANPILLYDGVCGLCNRLIQFVLKMDLDDVFRFAPLQGEFAQRTLLRHDIRSQPLDTMYVVLDSEQPGECLLSRSDAVIYILCRLGGIEGHLAGGFRLLPRPLRDFLYDLVARKRYLIFGRHKTCPMPDPRVRSKFLGL
jgi:predicted DCC family thiol-disulfide oxidoreductase YuxK